MKNTFFSSLTFLILITPGLFGEEGAPVLIKRDLKPGKTYFQSTEMNQEMDMSGAGQKGQMVMKMSLDMTLAVTKHEEPGKKILSIKYSRMAMSMDGGGQSMKADTDKPSDDPKSKAMLESLQPMIKSNIKATVDAKNEIVELEGLDALGKPGSAGAKMFNKDTLKQMMGMNYLQAPERPVKPGEEWPMEVTITMSGMGALQLTGNCKFLKTEEVDGVSCALVESKGNIGMKLDGAGQPGSPTQEQIKALNMKMEGSFQSLTHFDAAANVEKKMEMDMEMKMTMNNPGKAGETITIPVKQHVVQKTTKVEDTK